VIPSAGDGAGDHGRVSTAPPSTRQARTARPRTVEEAPREPRFPRAGERLANVTSGAWAALQGAVLSFAVVALLAVVGTLGSSSGADDAAWAAATAVAAGLWLLGQGVPLDAGAGTITLIPLGLGALALFTVYVSAKRSALPSAGAWWGGTVMSVVVTTALAALTGSSTAGGATARIALAALAGLVVGGGGMALGMLGGSDGFTAAGLGRRLDPHVPDVLRLGLRAGGVAVAGAVAAAAVLTGVWVVAGRATSDDIVSSLDPGWVGGSVLAVAQLALLPNLVLWALAWIAGPGFAVGQDTVFSMAATQAGPLPAVPVLGALPGPDWSGPAAQWLPVALVGCGALAGWYAWRELEPGRVRWLDVAWIVAGIAVATGFVVGLLEWWASGAVGPGRLSEVGADPLLVGVTVAAEAAVGAAVVLAVGRLRAR
jgi:hypothetical protein